MMLKHVLLGATMLMTAPVLAQTAPSPAPTGQVSPQATPTTAAPTTVGDPAAAQPAPAAPDTAAAAPAPDQVASAVDQQFATYDKDGDGKLSEAEFGSWMVALKAQTDPATDANAPATKQWNRAAFAQADKDRSRSLTKAEVTGFLTPAAKS